MIMLMLRELYVFMRKLIQPRRFMFMVGRSAPALRSQLAQMYRHVPTGPESFRSACRNRTSSSVAYGGNHANLNVDANALYGFRSQDVLSQIAPVPLVMIQSTSDTASPQKVGDMLFAVARDPKRYVLIKASNHRFSGARDEFYAALGNAVTWMRTQITESRNKRIKY